MHRIDHATAAPGNLFTDGNPATATPSTTVTDDWLNDVQENVCDVVETAGLALVKGDYTQLRQAIQAMLIASQKAVIINNATFEASVSNGEAVRWDSGNSRFDGAVADGTSNNRAVGIADVTNSKVYLYGECPLFSGLTPGARYYLDGSTAGAITATAPTDAVMVGIAKSATVLWVDVDPVQAGRIRLTANITIYVATTGSDSNNGLSPGSPFLTLQKALNVLHEGYDLNGYVATIQLADGTYTGPSRIDGPFVGGGSVIINGNAGTPSNVILSTTSASAVMAYYGAAFQVQNLKVQTTTGGSALCALYGGRILFSNIVFGAVAGSDCHLYSFGAGAAIIAIGNYSVVGGAGYHIYAGNGGNCVVRGYAVTLTGTRAFSVLFAYAHTTAVIDYAGSTISGAATGTRYTATANGVINTSGGGASFFPGSVAGTTATGGQYV